MGREIKVHLLSTGPSHEKTGNKRVGLWLQDHCQRSEKDREWGPRIDLQPLKNVKGRADRDKRPRIRHPRLSRRALPSRNLQRQVVHLVTLIAFTTSLQSFHLLRREESQHTTLTK